MDNLGRPSSLIPCVANVEYNVEENASNQSGITVVNPNAGYIKKTDHGLTGENKPGASGIDEILGA